MRQLSLMFLLSSLLITGCTKEEFQLQERSNKIFHVKNGDYMIPVLVRGNTTSKKIILFIQGGPGSNTLDFATIDYPGWKNTLEKDFAIAYYEQRGMGNIQGNFKSSTNLLDIYLEDLHKVAIFLKQSYNADVIMLGHSFGGGLMYRYMLKYDSSAVPVKFIAASAPATTDEDDLRWDFRREFLLNTANIEIARGNNTAEWQKVLLWLDEHPQIRKIEGDEPYKVMNEWNQFVEDLVYAYYPEKSLTAGNYLRAIFASPYNPLQAYLKGNYKDEIASQIIRDENEAPLITQLSGITQPILLITGLFDDVCPPEELKYIYNGISSPDKKISIIDKAGHEVYNHQAEEFNNQLKDFVQ